MGGFHLKSGEFFYFLIYFIIYSIFIILVKLSNFGAFTLV